MVETDPIVAGVDGTTAGVRALRSALEEARLRQLPILAVTACRAVAGASHPPALEPYEQCMRRLSSSVRTCLADAPDPPLRAELVVGRAADVLVARSEHAAMLVLGERGPRDAEHLGGTVGECLRRARCPVLIVPAAHSREPIPEPAANDPVLD